MISNLINRHDQFLYEFVADTKKPHSRSITGSVLAAAGMARWLAPGMTFFRNEPINEVAQQLNMCTQGVADLCDGWAGFRTPDTESLHAHFGSGNTTSDRQHIPSEVSFKFAYPYIAAQLIVMAGAPSPGNTQRHCQSYVAILRCCLYKNARGHHNLGRLAFPKPATRSITRQLRLSE
jgi:hypothetical protein